jgi:hypothetical protein
MEWALLIAILTLVAGIIVVIWPIILFNCYGHTGHYRLPVIEFNRGKLLRHLMPLESEGILQTKLEMRCVAGVILLRPLFYLTLA